MAAEVEAVDIDPAESKGVAALTFASAARRLAEAARGEDLTVPGFRSPPRSRHDDRTLRWTDTGHPIVSVKIRGRHRDEVIGDLVDGVLAANRRSEDVALRNRLLVAMGERP